MSVFNHYVRSTAFIAMVTTGMVLLAATDGANAKVGSDETRASGPSPTANLIWNTIHPIIDQPGGDHKPDHCHQHDRCDAPIRFLGPPIPAPIYGGKSTPVARGSGSAPGKTLPTTSAQRRAS
jgi:hypothetical protein